MHIPDGFVSASINLPAAALSIVAMGYGLREIREKVRTSSVVAPLFAVIAAFIFAAQMLNFPIGGATSGHFLGAVLAASLLGPWAACLALGVVLTVQAVAFGDGGLSALGTNILSMGVIGGVVAYPLMRKLRSFLPSGQGGFYVAVGMASWASIVMASAVFAVELALSGASPLSVALPAMLDAHMMIGVGEALITVAAVKALSLIRADVLPSWADARVQSSNLQGVSDKKLTVAGMALSLSLAVFVSPFASGFPDGLERVAEDKGFIELASEEKTVWTASPFPDYSMPSIENEGLSTAMAGFVGTLLVFVFGMIQLKGVPRRG